MKQGTDRKTHKCKTAGILHVRQASIQVAGYSLGFVTNKYIAPWPYKFNTNSIKVFFVEQPKLFRSNWNFQGLSIRSTRSAPQSNGPDLSHWDFTRSRFSLRLWWRYGTISKAVPTVSHRFRSCSFDYVRNWAYPIDTRAKFHRHLNKTQISENYQHHDFECKNV